MNEATHSQLVGGALLAAMCVTGSVSAAGDLSDLGWRQLPPLPDPCGFASPFVGTSGDVLLVGGGANFPERQLWEGGKKIWHDTVYALGPEDRHWREVGHFPSPRAYGLSIPVKGGIICAGGSNAEGHLQDAFHLRLVEDRLEMTDLPNLPNPVAMGASALVGSTVYLAGGLESPDSTEALSTFYALDAEDPEAGWKPLPSWPGPGRSQAVAASDGRYFYLFSGGSFVPKSGGGAEMKLLSDAYRYAPDTGWEKLADLPHPALAAASPAPTEASFIFLIGGVDGTQAARPPQEFVQAPQHIIAYSVLENRWIKAGDAPVGRVCVSTAWWKGAWVLPSGERSAGVRSPEVWRLSISESKAP